MLRKITIGSVLLLFAALSSCGAMRRAGKDLFITAASPAIILYGAGTDAMESAEAYADGSDYGSATQVLWTVPAYLFHGVKHFTYAVIHVLDFAMFPIYAAADLHPRGPDIEPLQIYTGTVFDRREDDSGTDPESGETR